MQKADEQYIEIGYIARSHGTRGEVLIISHFDVPDLFEYCDILRFHNERGDLVPARIERARSSYKNGRLAFFVKFYHIAGRTGADRLKDKSVFAVRELLEQFDTEDTHLPYLNFEVLDGKDKMIGKVIDVRDTAAHWLLEVQLSKDEDERILVPAVEEYIRSVDEEHEKLFCKNLDVLMQI